MAKGRRVTTVYKDPRRSVEKRIDDLIARMTLGEKIGQMCQFSGVNEGSATLIKESKVGSLLNVTGADETNRIQTIAIEQSRLGIPLIFGLDVIHGYRTIFPIPLGLASSWNPDMVERTASIAATEAASEGIRWTFAPMVDIARDPRWGRIAEGAGEDPYLGSTMAKALVQGFQGGDLAGPNSVVACPKHYVAYGGAEGGRDYNTVDVSDRSLREVYLPPFETAIVDAKAGTIMSAFNDLNGTPASANGYTLTTILREEWGFDGFVVSDYNSIGELQNHGIAANPAEAAKEALNAGVDMDMQGNVYCNTLAKLVRERTVTRRSIDNAVRRILRIKYRLGLFDRPFVDVKRSKHVILSERNVQAALAAARDSIVLLKNQGALLPLDKNLSSLAVIGPLADDRDAPLGPWSCLGNPKDVVTVLDGIKSRASPTTSVLYAKGCDVEGNAIDGFPAAAQVAKGAKVTIVVVGETAAMSGEAASRASLDLPRVQERLVKAICETGVPVIEVLMNGRPLTIGWSAEHVPAILETWFLGIQAGNAIADVIFGDHTPGGKLPVTFPLAVGQVPLYYNHKNTGRPPTTDKWTSKYIDMSHTPLFPFGHGLSYTNFEYSNLQIKPIRIKPSGKVKITADVKNIGEREGDEVVQLYVRDVVASVTRPVKELKGYKRMRLRRGERMRVTFTIAHDQLSFVNREMKRVVEPGVFDVMVGTSSEDIRLTGRFEVHG